MKEKDLLLKIITNWVNSILLEFLLHLEELLKLKLLSKLMPMVYYKSVLLIKELESRKKLLLLMKKEDYLKRKSKKC